MDKIHHGGRECSATPAGICSTLLVVGRVSTSQSVLFFSSRPSTISVRCLRRLMQRVLREDTSTGLSCQTGRFHNLVETPCFAGMYEQSIAPMFLKPLALIVRAASVFMLCCLWSVIGPGLNA
ncbi:hypothetical protein N656DRAFT_555971 [Canariomyces notabilis]|uniref:Uncharacterized protein n=1 Tax=Canariomyces notabilis TaxID=2074819 RepID=A0AAN6TI71_9PEZI|nr:hypothetical protein N656DRAFT_555971 [Canariomyces arenarius]